MRKTKESSDYPHLNKTGFVRENFVTIVVIGGIIALLAMVGIESLMSTPKVEQQIPFVGPEFYHAWLQ